MDGFLVCLHHTERDNYMPIYDIKYLVSECNKSFPEIFESQNDVIYKASNKQPNTLHIFFKGSDRPEMIFVYNGIGDFKLMTAKCYIKENKSLMDIRSKLSNTQITLRNERRKKSK